MSAWKQLAYAGVICSPAILMALSLGPATGAGSSAPDSGRAETEALLRLAQQTTEAAATEEETEEVEEAPEFTEGYLGDPAHIEEGKVVWEVCAACHGARAYPGKGPKLTPRKYTPDFVFDRVTNGYKKMPPWKDVFTKEERMSVVAWVLSDRFAP